MNRWKIVEGFRFGSHRLLLEDMWSCFQSGIQELLLVLMEMVEKLVEGRNILH